jgi:F0F1-type ATP synthase assembly protein I
VSQPPEYPGRQRFKRVAAAAGSEAYQGAFEAIGSVLIACAFGYWVDSRWDTRPFGMLIGVVIGFAAMVLRLVRLGKELHPDSVGTDNSKSDEATAVIKDDLGVGEAPGMSSVLRDDCDSSDSSRDDANGGAK